MTGTDTGIGKTVTACALVRALRARGLDAGAMKPIETGVGATGPLDAIALRDAAGGADPLDDVCPQRFAMPAAPTVAAEADGREVDLRVVRGAYRRLVASHSLLTLEAAAARNLPVSGVVISHCSRALSDPDRANLEALLHQRAGEQLDVGFGVGGRRAQPVARARRSRNNGGNNEVMMSFGHIPRIGTTPIALGAPASSRPGGRSPP